MTNSSESENAVASAQYAGAAHEIVSDALGDASVRVLFERALAETRRHLSEAVLTIAQNDAANAHAALETQSQNHSRETELLETGRRREAELLAQNDHYQRQALKYQTIAAARAHAYYHEISAMREEALKFAERETELRKAHDTKIKDFLRSHEEIVSGLNADLEYRQNDLHAKAIENEQLISARDMFFTELEARNAELAASNDSLVHSRSEYEGLLKRLQGVIANLEAADNQRGFWRSSGERSRAFTDAKAQLGRLIAASAYANDLMISYFYGEPNGRLSGGAGDIMVDIESASYRDLLTLHDVEFVEAAFMRLLGRRPDPVGLQTYLARVRGGDNKGHILCSIRLSREGRTRAAYVSGMASALRAYRLRKIPLIGALLNRTVGLSDGGQMLRSMRRIELQLAHIAAKANDKIAVEPVVIQAMPASVTAPEESLASQAAPVVAYSETHDHTDQSLASEMAKEVSAWRGGR